jgi:hypothetical protein
MHALGKATRGATHHTLHPLRITAGAAHQLPPRAPAVWLCILRTQRYSTLRPKDSQRTEATLRTCLYFAIGAAASAVPAAQSTDFKVVMGALWLILFFGGCIISPATGVCINAVHADLRSFSSAMSMFA